MKRIFQLPLLIAIAVLTLTPILVYAINNVLNVQLTRFNKSSYGYDDHIILPDLWSGDRIPGQKISAIIDISEGLTIPGVDKEEIVAYYILNES